MKKQTKKFVGYCPLRECLEMTIDEAGCQSDNFGLYKNIQDLKKDIDGTSKIARRTITITCEDQEMK
jgi:hypothetical protein